MQSEGVTYNCVYNPKEHAESDPRPVEEGVSSIISSGHYFTEMDRNVFPCREII